MNVKKLNDAPIFDQLKGHWIKVVALLLLKLDPEHKGVKITAADMALGDRVLLTHGHHDGFTLKMVTPAEAERLAAHEQSIRSQRHDH